jgi:NAD(P)-dependent dehydrogenase (short-subunit alcohol dehydrogenase family)
VSDRLAGKVVLVTGASRNIGGTVAAAYAAEGAAVACNDVDPETATHCAESISAAGGAAIAVPGDVTDPAAMEAVVARIREEYGRVDVLLNNAASFRRGGVLSMQIEDFRAQLDVIVTGTFVASQTVARSMVETGTGGSIITVLSTAAWQGEAGNIGYSTAKSALINFTRSAAMELAPHGIRVNSFTPTATVPADPAAAERFLAGIERLRQRKKMDFQGAMPWQRLPTAEDYIGALVFLASDDAALMTGSNVTVDGGALAKYWAQPARRLDSAGPKGGTLD